MDDEEYADKLLAAFKGQKWESCLYLADMLDIPLLLFSDDEYSEIIRAEFMTLYPITGEQRLYDGRKTSGSCMWLVSMCCELSPHLIEKPATVKPLRWMEKSKAIKSAEYKTIKKHIDKLTELLKKMRIADDELTLSNLLGGQVEHDTTVIGLLENLDKHIHQSAKEPSILEKHIGGEIRRSKPDGLPVDVRVFIKGIARQLVKNLHLDHVPNKLITAIANLKYRKFNGMLITVTEKDVENLTRNQKLADIP